MIRKKDDDAAWFVGFEANKLLLTQEIIWSSDQRKGKFIHESDLNNFVALFMDQRLAVDFIHFNYDQINESWIKPTLPS